MAPSISTQITNEAVIERAYNDAHENGNPEVLLVPTQDMLPLIQPERVAQMMRGINRNRVTLAATILRDVYQGTDDAIARAHTAVATLYALTDHNAD